MDTGRWKVFKYADVFRIDKGKRLTKADMIQGHINYVGASDSNNGVTCRIGNSEHIFAGNKITVSYNGSIANAFYQKDAFWATDDVNVLSLKDYELNKNIAMFLIVLIEKEKYRFNYGRKWDKSLMLNSEILLPQENGIPAWNWMDNYIETLTSKDKNKACAIWNGQIDKRPIDNVRFGLQECVWKWFRYDEIFDIRKGFYNKKPEATVNGEIPFIGATDSNNGITSRCDLTTIEETSKTGEGTNAPLSEKVFEPNCITVSNNGSIGYAFYQPEKFTCTHDVNPLYLKGYKLNVYIAMFLCTLIEKDRYRWTYGRKWRPSRMPDSLIKLPVKDDGLPNWEWMENYIKSLPYSRQL